MEEKINWEDNKLIARLFTDNEFYQKMKKQYQGKIDKKYNWIFEEKKEKKISISDIVDECAKGTGIKVII